ncbi:MAG: helix-turn-helix transcriptional regulator [Clostridia bacterium]|nr:helix-turn-helix transcriptional regulator [Clostridia bacterium]
MKWNDAKKILNSDPEVAKALQENELEYQVIRQVIKARLDKNLTQKQLADLIGTQQSNISRFESGNYNPSLEFLDKLAKALDKKIELHLV